MLNPPPQRQTLNQVPMQRIGSQHRERSVHPPLAVGEDQHEAEQCGYRVYKVSKNLYKLQFVGVKQITNETLILAILLLDNFGV